MCRFYTYKFQDCEHIYGFHLLRCRRAGIDWTCNNNAVHQVERRVVNHFCDDCFRPSAAGTTSIWLDVARSVLSIEEAGGGTVSLQTGKDARQEIGPNGVMCGGLVPTLMIGEDFFNNVKTSAEQKEALLCQFIGRYVDYWDCEFGAPMRYLGYWMSKKELFIDLSQRFLDPFKAVCMGLYRQEHAVFDLNGMHELQVGQLREYLQKHVKETVAEAAKRDRAQEALAASNLAVLRLKDKEKTQTLDPNELYSGDVAVFDKGPGLRRSPRGHRTPTNVPRTPPTQATLDDLNYPITPRKPRTFATPNPSLSSSDSSLNGQLSDMDMDTDMRMEITGLGIIVEE